MDTTAEHFRKLKARKPVPGRPGDGAQSLSLRQWTVESSHNRARLVLLFLGPPQVLVNGEAVMGIEKAQKVLALLAYLAVEAHRPHPRAVLAALFWPKQGEEVAQQNLRKTLSRVRHAIGDSTPSGDRKASLPYLITDGQTIQFNPESDYWLDVAAFETLLANTQRHPHRRLDACPICVSQLAQASEYYRGEFLAGLHLADNCIFDEWLLIQREGLRQQVCGALHTLASSHLARGEPQAARQYARQLLELDPWNEAGHRLLLRALTLSEGRNAALQHHQAFRQALADELGIEPEDETCALAEQIGAGTLADMQPRMPTAHLPVPATPFVGREAERKQISDYLAGQDQRLITLCGPGGSGKTRLALEMAAEQAPLWRDGVWFIPLAGVPEAEHLLDALAVALGLQTAGRSPEPADLIEFLRTKELLLILDGFEHLVASPQSPPPPFHPPQWGGKRGVGLLQDILRWAPEVRILVTSRARLGLRGEWAVQLKGLEVPPPPPTPPPPPPHPSPSEGEGAREGVNVESYSAVKLFLQNARRVSSDFTLSPENLPDVVRICQLVDGLPLGIELAAAWVRLFPCRQIADEIEQSPDFLHNPGGNGPQRQHSLRATFEYSYNLLSETEQTLFRKLSVFRGGFMPEAARQVVGATPSGLASLLDKSLLQVSPSRRLDLHLTLRQYAAEKLAAVPQEQWETQERHCRTCYLPFVQHREEMLRGEGPKAALEEIEVELSNVRAAWHWAVSQGKVEEIDASIRGLSRFYDLRGLLREAAAAFESAAARVLALGAKDSQAQCVAGRLLAEQARFLNRQGLYAQVIQVTQLAVELAQASQDKPCEASAICSWGEALWRQGNHEEARTQLERALSLARVARDATEGPADRLSQVVETGSLNMLGGLCWLQGDYAGARDYIEQAWHVAVKSGDRQDEARFLMNLGVLAVEQGNYAEAEGIFQQSLHIQRAIGNRRSESVVLGNLGNVLLYLGAYAEAKTHYEQALRIQREVGAQNDEALSVGNLGLVYHYLGQHEIARDYSQQALEIAQRLGDRRAQGAMWMKLGHALAGLGQLEEATHAYQESVALRREMGWHNVAMESLAGLARVALAQGDRPQAQAYVEEILSHLETGTLDGTIDPFQIHLSCYRVLEANHDPRAGNILATAYDLLQERAAKITDEAMRRSFLENVVVHREILNEVASL